MPELPEVETVARDLRPRIVGATIVGARCSWARTLRTHTPEAFAAAVAGRRVEAVGRRAKLVVVDLSGDAALTIHLKMTGQLFVVPAELAGRSLRPARPRAGRRARAPLPRHPQVRQGRAVRPRSGHRRPRRPRSAAPRSSPRSGRSRSIRPSRLRDFRRRLRRRKGRLKPLLLDQSFVAGVGNIYADEALWAARLHPLRSAGDPPPGRRAPPLRGRSDRSWPRPSSGAAARSTTTRRPTATARCRSGCRSTSGPASRARAAAGRSGGSSSGRARRTSARGASGCPAPIASAPPRSCGG